MSRPLPIDMEYLTGLLRRLLETPSPTGLTDEVVALCCGELDRIVAVFTIGDSSGQPTGRRRAA